MAHTCSLRGIFPGVRAAGENDLASFRRQRRRKPGRGCGPFLELPRDEGRGAGSPRSAAIFYWECLRSGSPRSGIAGGRAAAAAGRETKDGRGRFAARRRRGTDAGHRTSWAAVQAAWNMASSSRSRCSRRAVSRRDRRSRSPAGRSWRSVCSSLSKTRQTSR